MKNLEFNSVLTGGRYPKGFCLPDYLRENGKFSREKTLKEIVREEYGEIDESGLKISVKDVTDEKFDGDYGYFFCNKAKHTALEFMLEKNGKSATFVADVFVPTKIKSYNFVVHLDFMKYLPTKYCPVEELMDGGIAVAHLYYKEISTDDGDFSSGIAPLFCDRSDSYAPGKLSLWAYAAKVVGEYLTKEGFTVKEKLYVAGHSRLGKTALLAAAKYDIFAGCMVNCSGCCGAAISRDKHGETIKVITDVFPFWFTPNYKKYAEKEYEMPFDQHYLMASVAPRKVFVVAASEDDWADTDAQYLCAEAASEAYKELGLTGLKLANKPLEIGEKNTGGEIAFFVRDGVHFFSREDWAFYLACLRANKS